VPPNPGSPGKKWHLKRRERESEGRREEEMGRERGEKRGTEGGSEGELLDLKSCP